MTSGTSAKTFVDTNVLIYAHDVDAGRKHEIAKDLLRRLWADRAGILSTQVLREFYVNATRKLRRPLAKAEARGVVDTYAPWCVEGIATSDIIAAFQLEDEARIGFWDALIIAVAARRRTSCCVGRLERRAVDCGHADPEPIQGATTGEAAPQQAVMDTPTEQLAAALADRYALQDTLDVGGMATVYLARDLWSGRIFSESWRSCWRQPGSTA